MDLVRFVQVSERLSASLGVAWASSVLRVFSTHLRPFQSAVVVLLAAVALHPDPRADSGSDAFAHQFSATAQRLMLTVYAQHVFTAHAVASDDTSGVIESAAYACLVLLIIDIASAYTGAEGEILLNSSKFMFAASLRGLLGRSRAVLGAPLSISALLLAYAAARALSPRKALTDGVCMMVFDEVGALFEFTSWPYVGAFTVCLLTSLTPAGADPVVTQLQEYSRLSVSDSAIRAAALLPYAPTLTLFVVTRALALAPDSVLTHTLRDITVIALFHTVVTDSNRALNTLLPNDRFFTFCVSLALLTGLQHVLQLAKKKTASAQDVVAHAPA